MTFYTVEAFKHYTLVEKRNRLTKAQAIALRDAWKASGQFTAVFMAIDGSAR